MPKKYVYTVAYSPDGEFLMFSKFIKGYYFKNKGGTGKIVKSGANLHGGGKGALPGGEYELEEFTKEGIISEGRREFTEECGRLISFADPEENGDGEGIVEIEIDEHTAEFTDATQYGATAGPYAAYYFEVTGPDLERLWTYLIGRDGSLVQGANAAGQVQLRRITKYAQIGEAFPKAPFDNELNLVDIWQLGRDQARIEALGRDEDTNWFPNIINHLNVLIDG